MKFKFNSKSNFKFEKKNNLTSLVINLWFQLLLEKFHQYENVALARAAKEKAERDDEERRRQERLSKKREEEKLAAGEPRICEITDEEADKMQQEIDEKVSAGLWDLWTFLAVWRNLSYWKIWAAGIHLNLQKYLFYDKELQTRIQCNTLLCSMFIPVIGFVCRLVAFLQNNFEKFELVLFWCCT